VRLGRSLESALTRFLGENSVVMSCKFLGPSIRPEPSRMGSQMAASPLRNRRAKSESESLPDDLADKMSLEVEGLARR
jgi:hypothetical protein